jgi:hypothetical protein
MDAMAFGSRKVHLKRAKKTAKRRKRKATTRREAALSSITNRLVTVQALQAPLYECWEPKGLFDPEAGMGTIVVSRKTSGDQILMGSFLLDVFCLGVKNAYCTLMDENEYRFSLQQIEKHQHLVKVHPACARKLVEEAHAYAEDLGFSPHRDYGFARKIFQDIQKDQCDRSFTFGRNGKPMYLVGLNDSARFSMEVINTLTARLGPEGFHFQKPLERSVQRPDG